MSDDNKKPPGKPFKEGHSIGRPVGRPNKSTQFLNAIGEANADEIIKKTVEQAKLGKPWACEAVLSRIYPPPRARLVKFPLPPLNSLADVTAAIAAVL